MKKKDPLSYTNRTYRDLVDRGHLISTTIMVRETDVHILAETDVSQLGHDLISTARNQLETYIKKNRRFLTSLTPLPQDSLAPKLIRDMLHAAIIAGIGPMAAVAGGIAEFVGRGLREDGITTEVMVENGGDIFLHRNKDCTIGIYAGEDSPLSGTIGVQVKQETMPMGICSSSKTIGHSLSLGTSDAVTVLAKDTTLADTIATRLGNEMQDDINHVLNIAKTFKDITGVVVVKGQQLGAWGDIELVKL